MDANYQLAGKAIERATRTTVGSALHRELLDPLGLDEIVLQPEQRPSSAAAHGYDARGRDLSDGSGYMPYTSWATASWTAGGLVASPQSLARFGDALFSGRVLKPDSLRAMVRFGDADYWDGYGLGVARMEVHGREVWGHGGRIPGFASELWHVPREHITLAVVANDEGGLVEETAAELLDAALEGAAQ